MGELDLKKIKNLFGQYQLAKKTWLNETDFKKKSELAVVLEDLQKKIENEIGRPISKKDKETFF